MATINDLDTIAQNGDFLGYLYINDLGQRIKTLEGQLAYANQRIITLQAQLSQAFLITPTAGLTAVVASGTIKLPSGAIATIPATTITLAASSVTIVYITPAGAIAQITGSRPNGYEIAKVTTSANTITTVESYPILEVRSPAINTDDLATIDYANSRAWKAQASGRKSQPFPIPATATYYIIPFETLDGTGLNTAGTFTAPLAGKYVFHAQIRLTTTATNSNPDMAAKLSLFASGQEIAILQQVESAAGDLTMNASNPIPVVLSASQQVNIRIYLTDGTQTSVRENSTLQIWLLPS